MKNYIKDFGQFQRINEQGFSQDPSWEELVDAIADRMYENGMNGTIASDGSITAHGRTLDGKSAEIIVTSTREEEEWSEDSGYEEDEFYELDEAPIVKEEFLFRLNKKDSELEISLKDNIETIPTTANDYEDTASGFEEKIADVMSEMMWK